MILTIITTTFTFLMALGKILIGLFSGFIVSVTGFFSLLMVASKTMALLGIYKGKGKEKLFTNLCGSFLLVAGVGYLTYMGAAIFSETRSRGYSLYESIGLAFIAFFELAVAVYGMIRTTNTGLFYRDIKIVNLNSALAAIVTAQIALLSLNEARIMYNGMTGFFVGLAATIGALYIFRAPYTSFRIHRFHRFELVEIEKNKLIDLKEDEFDLTLVKAPINGDICFKGKINQNQIDGEIYKKPSFWRKIPLWAKIIIIIFFIPLSIPYLLLYAVYVIRSWNMPRRLKKKMKKNGFKWIKVDEEPIDLDKKYDGYIDDELLSENENVETE